MVLGAFTYYGDQTLVLLKSIATKGGFDLDQFAKDWQNFFAFYDGYVDEATKGTFANISSGKDVQSAGSSRIAKYEKNLRGALIENGMAGGAADLKAYQEIMALLEKMDL